MIVYPINLRMILNSPQYFFVYFRFLQKELFDLDELTINSLYMIFYEEKLMFQMNTNFYF